MGRLGFGILVLFFLSCLVSAAYEDVSLTYDANGNLIQDADFYYEYNGFNNLVRVREDDSGGRIVSEFVYTPDGKRIKKRVNKTEGWETTYYIGDIVRVVNSSGTFDTVYVHDNQGVLLARQEDDGKKYYYHPDHLGSTRLITDQAGDVVEEIEYLPFGADLTNSTQKYTFTGQESDSELNLMYYGARYHSPYLRQFIEPDSSIPDIYNPEYLNRYAYTLNNPVKYVDPTGKINQQAVQNQYEFGSIIMEAQARYPKKNAVQLLRQIGADYKVKNSKDYGIFRGNNADYTRVIYLYSKTEDNYVDSNHFFIAGMGGTYSEKLTVLIGDLDELKQELQGWASGFDKEDRFSNKVGAGFGAYVKNNPNEDLHDLFYEYIQTYGPSDNPQLDDPNYNSIPSNWEEEQKRNAEEEAQKQARWRRSRAGGYKSSGSNPWYLGGTK